MGQGSYREQDERCERQSIGVSTKPFYGWATVNGRQGRPRMLWRVQCVHQASYSWGWKIRNSYGHGNGENFKLCVATGGKASRFLLLYTSVKLFRLHNIIQRDLNHSELCSISSICVVKIRLNRVMLPLTLHRFVKWKNFRFIFVWKCKIYFNGIFLLNDIICEFHENKIPWKAIHEHSCSFLFSRD